MIKAATAAPTPPSPRFMEGVVTHLEAFARAAGVKPESIQVRLLLADGESRSIQGLKVSGAVPPGALGWGMIEAAAGTVTTALVIRESHVVKVEFDVSPNERKPIGLHTEAGK